MNKVSATIASLVLVIACIPSIHAGTALCRWEVTIQGATWSPEFFVTPTTVKFSAWSPQTGGRTSFHQGVMDLGLPSDGYSADSLSPYAPTESFDYVGGLQTGSFITKPIPCHVRDTYGPEATVRSFIGINVRARGNRFKAQAPAAVNFLGDTPSSSCTDWVVPAGASQWETVAGPTIVAHDNTIYSFQFRLAVDPATDLPRIDCLEE